MTVTVVQPNRAPTCVAPSLTTPQDTAAQRPAQLQRPRRQHARLLARRSRRRTAPLGGAGRALTYTPAAGYTGADSFTFKANDGTVDSVVATAAITVSPSITRRSPPTAAPRTDQDTAVAFTCRDRCRRRRADLRDRHRAGARHLSGSGASRTYTPAAGYSGPDSFTFKANDGTTDSNTATVSITVRAALTPPPTPSPTPAPKPAPQQKPSRQRSRARCSSSSRGAARSCP